MPGSSSEKTPPEATARFEFEDTPAEATARGDRQGKVPGALRPWEEPE